MSSPVTNPLRNEIYRLLTLNNLQKKLWNLKIRCQFIKLALSILGSKMMFVLGPFLMFPAAYDSNHEEKNLKRRDRNLSLFFIFLSY